MKGNVLHFFRDHQICIMTKSLDIYITNIRKSLDKLKSHSTVITSHVKKNKNKKRNSKN